MATDVATGAVRGGERITPVVNGSSTLVEGFLRQVRTRPDSVAMYFRAGERWAPITWRQFGEAARRVSTFLVSEGVGDGEHAAIWAGNRPEWHIADAGILCAGVCPVPVYFTVSAEQAAYVLGHSEARVAFVESPAVLARLLSVRDRLPQLQRVVVMAGLEDASSEDGLVLSWQEALARGDAASTKHAAGLERRMAAISPNDVATLIYTSGTTGPPKAVMLTHRNCMAAGAAFASFVPADENDRILSYLPLAHIAERGASEFRQYIFGNPTYFASSIDRLAEHLRDVRPTLFFGVPRVWEKMAGGIRAQLDAAPGVRGRLARWAVAVGERAFDARQQGREVGGLLAREWALADRLVLSKIRAATGLDQARLLASGAAPISAGVLRLLGAVGLEVLEVYGQTENTGATTMNRPGKSRIGTVGTPVPGVEVRIAADGEICVRGEVVFAGYHKDEAATAETVVDGWLLSGDVGEFDADGYLRITDRKKDLIITAGGKNIAPSNIETALQRHRLIGNAVVIGDRRPYVSALLTLDMPEAEQFLREGASGVSGDVSIAHHPAIREELRRHVEEVNTALSGVEQVKRWTVLENVFSIGEELTPTLKLRRKVVAERYSAQIEANYSATN
jgi:long-chain acyl-CoA synthetase